MSDLRSLLIKGYSIEGGPVFAYKALPDFTLEPNNDYSQNTVERAYVRILEDAFVYWGKEFEAEYHKTIEPFDPDILHVTHKILLKDSAIENQTNQLIVSIAWGCILIVLFFLLEYVPW